MIIKVMLRIGSYTKFRGLRRHTFSRILKSISFDTIAEIKIYT